MPKSNYTSKPVKRELIQRLKRILFFTSVTFIILAQAIDLLLLPHSAAMKVINPIIIIFVLLTLSAYLFRLIDILWANSIVIYIIVFEMLLSPYLNLGHSDFNALFIRSILIIFAIIPYASFTVNTLSGLIIGIVYFCNIFVISFIAKTEFLINGIGTLSMVYAAYTFGIYYLIKMLVKAIKTQEYHIFREQEVNTTLQAQKVELKKVIDSKNKLVSIISHDLKNPFNTILGFIQLMESDIKNNKKDKLISHLDYLRHSAERTYLLLENLLEWAKNEQNSLSFNPQKVNVFDLITDVCELLSHELKRKGLSLINIIDRKLYILADELMLKSIFRNLLTNAIKFSSNEGEIILRSNISNNNIKFSVSDNGIGIPDDQINKLFSDNRKLNQEGTQNEKGTGLGLFICKDFVEIHNGEIWAEDNSGKGTTFYFTIPQ